MAQFRHTGHGLSALEWILIRGAEAIHWACSALAVLVIDIAALLGEALNPLLSPLLALFNPWFTQLGDAIYVVLGPLGPLPSLTALSVLTGLGSLAVFRVASNQQAIGRALDDIKANLLALKLFKDDLRVAFRCQLRLLGAVARLQWRMLPPFMVMLIPMLPLLAQMGVRHQWRPLRIGERALVELRLSEVASSELPIRMEAPSGVAVEVDGIPGGGRWVWRIRGEQPGRHVLRFHVGDEVVEKELVVGESFERVSAWRTGPRWTTQLLHPLEPPLNSAALEAIEIGYPPNPSRLHGSDYWVVYFFVISMLTALVFKGLFRVRF